MVSTPQQLLGTLGAAVLLLWRTVSLVVSNLMILKILLLRAFKASTFAVGCIAGGILLLVKKKVGSGSSCPLSGPKLLLSRPAHQPSQRVRLTLCVVFLFPIILHVDISTLS